MASNKKIKADNQIEVEATNINLEATTDVTGDLNVSSNLDVTGTINSFNLPSADGTDGQIIKTDGSGNLSFIDAASGGGGGVDEITSQSDATNYTGTARVIYVSASGTIAFSSDLRDRIIISSDGSNGNTVEFSNCNVIGCTIRGYTNVTFECTSVSSMLVWGNDIHVQNSVTLNNGSAGPGNKIMFRYNRVTAGEDLKLLNWDSNTVDSQKNVINVYRIYTSGSSTLHMDSVNDRITCVEIFGSFELDKTVLFSGSGTPGTDTLKITIGSFVFGPYQYPYGFKVLDNKFVPQNTEGFFTATNPSSFQSTWQNVYGLSLASDRSSNNASVFFNIDTHTNTNDKITFNVTGRYRVSFNARLNYTNASYIPSGTSIKIYGIPTSSSAFPKIRLTFYDGLSGGDDRLYGYGFASSTATNTFDLSTIIEVTNTSTQYLRWRIDDCSIGNFEAKVELLD